MNFTQMHERLRLEMLRRIERGTLSVSLLARQTGFVQSHVSNFLRRRRQLSLEGIDRVLSAQHMGADELLPMNASSSIQPGESPAQIPLVSHAAAMHEPVIRQSAVHSRVWVPWGPLQAARSWPTRQRENWERFVAIMVTGADAIAMSPLVQADGIAVLDRHYNSLTPYRVSHPNLYAMRMNMRLKLRYADFALGRIVLRPHNRAIPVELTDMEPGETPSDLIIGRVIFILNEY